MPRDAWVRMIRQKYRLLDTTLNERARRHWAATEALACGYGGITIVTEATGLAHNTIRAGISELHAQTYGDEKPLSEGRIRRAGGGRKKLTEKDPTLLSDLDKLVDPLTRGDPESDLRWTSKSMGKIAEALQAQQHTVSPDTVGRLLQTQGYRLQSNRKRFEGKQHPDRDGQFRHIAATVKDCHERHQPVISVDTKKKGLIGNFKNGGREGERQKLADELHLPIRVCHFPPGTSKWNKIEHRMFSFISKNWRGKPLLDRATVINLIAKTRTKAGLRIDAGLDTNTYRTKIKVPDTEMKKLNLHLEEFHGEWNYRLEPRG